MSKAESLLIAALQMRTPPTLPVGIYDDAADLIQARRSPLIFADSFQI